jgi:hypothetical protein
MNYFYIASHMQNRCGSVWILGLLASPIEDLDWKYQVFCSDLLQVYRVIKFGLLLRVWQRNCILRILLKKLWNGIRRVIKTHLSYDFSVIIIRMIDIIINPIPHFGLSQVFVSLFALPLAKGWWCRSSLYWHCISRSWRWWNGCLLFAPVREQRARS